MESLIALKNWMIPGKYLSDALLCASWTYVMDREMPHSLLKDSFIDPGHSDIHSEFLRWRAASDNMKISETDGDE